MVRKKKETTEAVPVEDIEEMAEEIEQEEEDITEEVVAEIIPNDMPDYIARMDDFDMDELLSRITAVDEVEQFVKAVVYGDNGSGKTSFAASSPDVLIIDINEKGTKSAQGTGAKVLQVKSQEDIYGLYWYLQSGKHPFKTVVLDTMTQWEDMTLKYVMNKDMESDMTRDPEMATIRDYGKRAVIMKSWIINFRDLPMNVIFVCQKASRNEEDMSEDDVAIYPMLSEKIRKCLCGAVDVIGYTYKKETLKPSPKDPSKMIARTSYCMRVGPSERYQTKIRIPKGYTLKSSIITNPTFDKLVEYMAGVKPVKKEEE